ncbi:MAG: insulinase family protein [Chloroflexi bacterium]|nr:insulinase family protein [Chloroflexota bacterium]
MAERRSRLPVLDVRSLPGPETIQRRQLPNGLVILARENFSSPSVVLTGSLAAGALGETKRNAGLADLTASALMRGTSGRPFERIYETIEGIGASLSIGAGTHATSFRGKSLAEDLNVLLDLLSDVVRHPSFPPVQVDRLRAEKLTALSIRDQDTASVAQLAFDELLYGDHPYALPSDGYRESVGGLTDSAVRAFHRRAYGPAGMLLAIVGAVPAARALDAAEAVLGDWRNPEQPAPPAMPSVRGLAGSPRRDTHLPGKSQCDLVVGSVGPSRFDPDYLVAALGNNILGRFGLMGRLGDVVRERAGLAYSVASSITGGPGPGPWQVMAGVAPANVERAFDLIREEIGRFVRGGVTPQELSDNQANFIGRLPLQLESNEGVAGALVNMERFELGLDFYQRYPERVAGITREHVRAAAARFLEPELMAMTVAGPGAGGT